MAKFKVIDTTTGREVSAEKIGKFAKENGLIDTNIDQFFIGEDGRLVLADDSGKIAYCDTKGLKIHPVLTGKYPDLEYFERIMIGNALARCSGAFPQVEFVAMFPQNWPDTAGGFSRPGVIAGQAFTTQITTVMEAHISETEEDFYGVFFDNVPAYFVEHAPEAFFKDLNAQSLKSKYDAQEAY